MIIMNRIRLRSSSILNECTSIDEVVEIINSGGTSKFNANEIAVLYGFQAITKEEWDVMETEDNLKNALIFGHIQILEDNGANINWEKANKLIDDVIVAKNAQEFLEENQ